MLFNSFPLANLIMGIALSIPNFIRYWRYSLITRCEGALARKRIRGTHGHRNDLSCRIISYNTQLNGGINIHGRNNSESKRILEIILSLFQ